MGRGRDGVRAFPRAAFSKAPRAMHGLSSDRRLFASLLAVGRSRAHRRAARVPLLLSIF